MLHGILVLALLLLVGCGGGRSRCRCLPCHRQSNQPPHPLNLLLTPVTK